MARSGEVPVERLDALWRQGLDWKQIAQTVGRVSAHNLRNRLEEHYCAQYFREHPEDIPSFVKMAQQYGVDSPEAEDALSRSIDYHSACDKWVAQTLADIHDPEGWRDCPNCEGTGKVKRP
jgi:hypothetical protein